MIAWASCNQTVSLDCFWMSKVSECEHMGDSPLSCSIVLVVSGAYLVMDIKWMSYFQNSIDNFKNS